MHGIVECRKAGCPPAYVISSKEKASSLDWAFVGTLANMSEENTEAEGHFTGRMIKIQRFELLYPEEFGKETPRLNSTKLGHSARQQFDIYLLVRKSCAQYGRSEIFFLTSLIPTMHIIIELLGKALAYELDPNFQTKNNHNVWGILAKYAEKDAVLSEIIQSKKRKELILELEEGFINLRYGKSHVFITNEAVREFESLADDLFNNLRKLSGLPFKSMLDTFPFDEDRRQATDT